ncbi:MAG: NOG1 family protein [Halobacteriales archaeon]
MPFEELPTVPSADELVDRAFSRAARTGRAKHGVEAQRAMLDVAGNVLSDNLEHVVRSWPDLDGLHPYHRAIADVVAGVDDLREHLGAVDWAAGQVTAIAAEHRSRVRGDADLARRQRKQAFARMADVLEEVAEDLEALESARRDLARLPGIDPEVPTVVVAGYPNVGKSSFLAAVTRARPELATYPFTTTAVGLGHVEVHHITYQIVDTPGLLDRPAAERNDIERRAMVALEHLADAVVVLLDPSETCGYPIERQLALRDELADRFARAGVSVISVANKADLPGEVEADYAMSITEGEGVEAVLVAAVEAVGYEPELPSRRE